MGSSANGSGAVPMGGMYPAIRQYLESGGNLTPSLSGLPYGETPGGAGYEQVQGIQPQGQMPQGAVPQLPPFYGMSSTGGLNPFYGGGSNPLWPSALPSSYNLAGQSFGAMTPPGQGVGGGQQSPVFSGPITTPSVALAAPPPLVAPQPSTSVPRAYAFSEQGGRAGGGGR